MARDELWLEVGILRRLVYKNTSQHRSSLHMQKMREVRMDQSDWVHVQVTLQERTCRLLIRSVQIWYHGRWTSDIVGTKIKCNCRLFV